MELQLCARIVFLAVPTVSGGEIIHGSWCKGRNKQFWCLCNCHLWYRLSNNCFKPLDKWGLEGTAGTCSLLKAGPTQISLKGSTNRFSPWQLHCPGSGNYCLNGVLHTAAPSLPNATRTWPASQPYPTRGGREILSSTLKSAMGTQ